MDTQKVTETLKFLLSSVSKLSDRFLDSTDATRSNFEQVANDIDNLIERISRIEADLTNWRDQQLVSEQPVAARAKELPIKPGQENLLIPALNLSTDLILEAYRSTPALLQPFSRSCSVSGRTLSGMIDEVELEVFAQGTTWLIETQDGDWLLFPRPGLINRRSQLQNLQRLFEIDGQLDPPADVDLLMPGRADVVEHGRRWYLSTKGRIGLQDDPMHVSLETRLARLDDRLKAVETRRK
jgi:hypothetical protein